MYFLSLESVPQLLGDDTPIFGGTAQFLGELPQFWGELPQFSGGIAPIFGAIAPNSTGEGLRTCLEGNETLPLVPKSLNLLPENQMCDYSNKTTKRGVIIVLQQHDVTVCKLLI